MNDLPGLPPVSVDKGVGAPVPDPGESTESEAEGRQAFDEALEDGGDLYASQAPQTRRAIKGSLDQLPDRQGVQAPPIPGAVKTPQDRPGAGGLAESVDPGPSGPSGVAATAPTGEPPVRPAFNASVPPASNGPQRGAAPNRPRSRDAPPSARATASGPAGVGGPTTAPPRKARAPGKDEAAPPRPMKDAHGIGDRQDHPPARAQAPLRTLGTRPTGVAPQQSRSGQKIDPSQSWRSESERASDAPRSRGPEEADRPEAQSADLTGLTASAAVPLGAPEPGRIDAPDSVQAPAPHAAELAEKVADRILASVPEPGSSGEVRISLKESVLDGSDVRIFHEAGELRIVFVPKTEAAERLLADNGSAFQQALGERLQDERVRVEVEPPNRDSRDATGQQDNEGRSRQQYVAPDDPSEPN